MDMVGHEYERMNRDPSICCCGANAFQVLGIVAFVEETGLAVDAPRNDMLRETRDIDTRQSGHNNREVYAVDTQALACPLRALRSISQTDTPSWFRF